MSRISWDSNPTAAYRRFLLSELIKLCTGYTEGEAEHTSLLTWALRAVQHPKHMDTKPSVVQEDIKVLSNRFAEHAHMEKQRCMTALVEHLFKLNVASDQADSHHRIIALLLSCSHAPLTKSFCITPFIKQLLPPSENYLNEHECAASDNTSWAEEPGIAGGEEGSSLSDWSDHDGKSDGDEVGLEDQEAFRHEVDLVQHPSSESFHHIDRLRAKVRLQQCSQSKKLYEKTSLSVWLASKQTGGQPQQVLEPKLCFTEKELLEQVLLMLQGVDHPGRAFRAQGNGYAPVLGVHLHRTSPASMSQLLLFFTRTSTILRQVYDFAKGVLHEHTAQTNCGGLSNLPTIGAFAAAVEERMMAMRQLFAIWHAELALDNTIITLLALQRRMKVINRELMGLHSIIQQARMRNTSAETVAGLLSAISLATATQMQLAGCDGGSSGSCHLKLFLKTIRPYMKTLNTWLAVGDLDDPYGEFFIKKGSDGDAFEIVLAGDRTPAAPEFLKSLVDEVLSAGKAAALLRRYANASPQRSVADALAAAASNLIEPLETLRNESHSSPTKRRVMEFGILGYDVAQQVWNSQNRGEVLQPTAQGDETPSSSIDCGRTPGDHSEHIDLFLNNTSYQDLYGQLISTVKKAYFTPRSSSSSIINTTATSLKTLTPRPLSTRLGYGAPFTPPQVGSMHKQSQFLSPNKHLPALAPLTTHADSLNGLQKTSTDVAIAQRMRQSARAYASSVSLAKGRDVLLASVLASGSVQSRPASSGELCHLSGHSQSEEEQGLMAAFHDAQTAAHHFESGRWAEWYEQLSGSLSSRILTPGRTLYGGGGGGAAPSHRSHRDIGDSREAFQVPGALPRYGAVGVLETIGRRGRGGDEGEDDVAWLVPTPSLPPFVSIVHQCLVYPVKKRAEAVGHALTSAMLRQGLVAQLRGLQDVSLQSTICLEPFVNGLLRKLSQPKGLGAISEFELNALLQTAIEASQSVALKSLNASCHQRQGPHEPSLLLSLNRLRVCSTPSWPLSLVASSTFLELHTELAVFMCQLKWVEASVKSLHYALVGKQNKKNPQEKASLVVVHQMNHLALSSTRHFVGRVTAAGEWLASELGRQPSLEGMTQACDSYCAAVKKYCLLSHDMGTRLAKDSLMKSLDSALQYCMYANELKSLGKEGPVEEGRADRERRKAEVQELLRGTHLDFINRQRLLLRVLRTRAGNGPGDDPLTALLAAIDIRLI